MEEKITKTRNRLKVFECLVAIEQKKIAVTDAISQIKTFLKWGSQRLEEADRQILKKARDKLLEESS